MQRPGGVEHVRPGAGRVERADDLLADVGGLPDAGDGDPPAAGEQQPGDAVEPVVEPAGDHVEGRGLGPEDPAGEREPVERRRGHGTSLCRGGSRKPDRRYSGSSREMQPLRGMTNAQ